MLDVLCSLIMAFATTYVSLPVIIHIADHKKLYDLPDGRKVHRAPIASLGGIGIFGGFSLACLIFVNYANGQSFAAYLGAALIIFFLGMKDDILVISPLKKFVGQILAALVVIFKGNVLLNNLHGFLGIQSLPLPLSMAVTVIVIVLITNSFNLIDGLDGLAGSLGLATSTLFGFFFLDNGVYPYAVMAFALSGSLLAFLWFNFQPARIFMGDTGSLLVGLVNAILVLKFVQLAPYAQHFHSNISLAIGCSIIAVPLMDTLRVFSIRVWNKRSPFSADRNHIHHILLDKGLTHSSVTLILLTFNVLMVVMTYLTSALGTTVLVFLLIATYFFGVWLFKKLPLLFLAEKNKESRRKESIIKAGNLVSLASDMQLDTNPDRMLQPK